MKYIYSLLLIFFAVNQLSAENWVKAPENIRLRFHNLDCIIYNERDEIDSFDIDCIKNIKNVSISSKFTENDTINLNEINFLLQHIENIELFNIIGLREASVLNNTQVHINMEAIKSRKIKRLAFSLEYDTIKIINFPSDINTVSASLDTRHIEIDSIKNIESFVITPTSGNISDSIKLEVKKIENLGLFLCYKYITNNLPEIHESLRQLGVVVDNRNLSSVVQNIANANQLSKLDSVILFLREDFEIFNTTDIGNIKSLSLGTITPKPLTIQQFYTNRQHISFAQSNINIKKLDLHKGLENYYVHGISDPTFKLPALPTSLQILYLYDLNIDCLPSFPPSLREFNRWSLPKVNCIPNETLWVKATPEWPLCNDERYICDKEDIKFINGKVYLDINNNGIIDNNDRILSDAILSTDKNQLANSKEDGTYGIILRETGSYLLSATYNHPHFKQSVPANVTVNYQEGQPIDSVHFLIQVDNKNDVLINGTNLVARPGMATKVISFVENLSLENKSDLTVKILKPADWNLEEALPVGYAVSNDTIIWNNVSIPRLKNSSFSVSSTLPATAAILGDAYQYQMWVDNDGDVTPDNNYYSIMDIITGSYDPNDKIVNHIALTPESSNVKELIYTIRFQNTGTDTAFKVVIIDTIIGNLEPSSIKVLGASHNYTWDFSGQGIATFVFDNILLPDSNINEPGSHGFVTLVLRPSKDLMTGDSIYNRAGIYFDFNEPVITNYTNTIITTGTSVYSHSNIPLSIYPNPAKNQVRVEWKVAEPAILRLSDISGKVIRTERLNNGFTDINVSQLPKGLYIVQLQAGQHMAVSKLIVQ